MREIKFREFVNGKFHYWGFTEEGIFKGPVTPSLTRGQHQQFTGLKDKNGKEIYEGDIISWDYEYDSDYDGDMPIVKRSTGKCVIKDIFDRHQINRAAEESRGCEIIGNLYEHPELVTP